MELELDDKREVSVFVAGLPSQVDNLAVLAFFKKMTPRVRLSEYLDQYRMYKLAGKGCCILDFLDNQERQRILKLKYVEFMGRTVTLSPFKTGVDLIIQNKKLKKCRVQLKKVPCYLKEEDLKAVLEQRFGKVYLLYQLKSEDPRKSKFATLQESRNKFLCYSVYFNRTHNAKKLIAAEKILLEDGHSILVKKPLLEKHQQLRVVDQFSQRKDPSKQEGDLEIRHREVEDKTFASKHIRPADKARDKDHPASSHWIKPTQNTYYSVIYLGARRRKMVLEKSSSEFRLNRVSRALF